MKKESLSIEELKEIKSNLYGRKIRNLTAEDILKKYEDLYGECPITLDKFSKIRMRNRLVEMINITIFEKEMEIETGLNEIWIKDRIIKALNNVEKKIGKLDTNDYNCLINFYSNFGMSDLVWWYKEYEDNYFQLKVKELFSIEKITEDLINTIAVWNEDRENGVYYLQGELLDKEQYDIKSKEIIIK